MICFPNCKINLGLNIVEKRSDGFHNIETVFYPVSLCDALEVEVSNNDTTFEIHGNSIPGKPEENLCLQAYQLLGKDYILPPVHLHLLKNIPIGAGLGGGSSDAAHCLKLFNSLFSLCLSNKQLQDYASQLGSDCAFFIENKPVFASGKGNQFSAIDVDLKRYFLVVVKPDLHIATSEAYTGAIPEQPENSLKEIIALPVSEWKHHLVNDFEKSIFKQFPTIEKIKELLYHSGALYASMSGSGSAVFGIFDHPSDVKKIFPDCFVRCVAL